VTGDGPIDMIYVPGWVSNLDYHWESPRVAHVFNRLGSFCRLIRCDKRGTGLSDRNVGFPTLEQRMEDVRSVLDAVGSKRTVVFGSSEGGNMCMLFAAAYPERTAALVLNGAFAKGLWSEDYPWAKTKEQMEEELSAIEQNWGDSFDLSNASPSLIGDAVERDWFGSFLRNSASPADAIDLWRWNTEIDVRNILPAIHVPTLIVQRTGDRWVKVDEGRYLAQHIAGAKYLEIPGDDHVIWGADCDRLVDEIQAFVSGLQPTSPGVCVLLTVLSLAVVGETSQARHEEQIRTALSLAEGENFKPTGNGFRATFQGPTRAIQCAMAIRDRMNDAGCGLRAAIHIGECEASGGGLNGAAVEIASRLLDRAHAGEIIASRTVRDLAVGSGFAFEDRGTADFNGITGTWQIFSIGERASGPA
jgi:pimeloyl-ACP methyl ester carboxylesterase